jgi:predicted RNA-binding Zn ribbon-like protein
MKKGISPPRLKWARLGGAEFDYIGGHPVLDFHNTIAWPRGRKSNERLRHPVDFVRWAGEAGVTRRRETDALGVFVRRNYSRACAILEDALRVRDVLHDLFLSVLDEAAPNERTILEFNRLQTKARASVAIEWHRDRLRWAPKADPPMMALLDRIVWQASELLTSDDVKRVRRCANPACGWLFVDHSRNGTRRWCSMSECGDRAKSKRHYQRSVQDVRSTASPG